jgi:murein L,D-transpeptidase YafK
MRVKRFKAGHRMRLMLGMFAIVAGLLLTAAPPAVSAEELQRADLVVVHKAARRMELKRNDKVIATYKISLGLDPLGHKQREGDFRTPEGRYYLVRRNSKSDYFLSIQISYPNDRDKERARRGGYQPGGSIMIHGLPNQPQFPPDHYTKNDWTNGCIAVTNSDMVEIWLLTPENIPIDILP